MKDDGAGCALAILFAVASFVGGAAMVQSFWVEWYREDLIERGEAHYDAKTGAWVSHEKAEASDGHP